MSLIEKLKNILEGVTQPIQFGDLVLAGATQTETYEFLADGQLQGKLRIRFYSGAELDLWLYPTILRSDGGEDNIIQYRGTKKYVDGEDDILQWDINRTVYRGDKLVVKAVNNNATYNYDYRLDASVNYVGMV